MRRWAVALALLIAIVFATGMWHPIWDAIGERLGGNCLVGVEGHAAMLRIEGWGASGTCSQIVNDPANDASNGGLMYAYSGDVVAPPICQLTLNGRRYTVYNQGLTDAIGNQMCDDLHSGYQPIIYNGPAPPPTPEPMAVIPQNTAEACWINQRGANELIVVSGAGSGTDPRQECMRLTSGNTYTLVDPSFRPSDGSSESLVCQTALGAYQYTIYDTGFHYWGSYHCRELQQGVSLVP